MTAEIPDSVYEDAARAALGVSHDKADQYAVKMLALDPSHRATVGAGYLAGRLHADGGNLQQPPSRSHVNPQPEVSRPSARGMTADPRSAALTWLTDRYRDAEKVCGASGARPPGPCPECVADAILSDAVVEWRKLRLGPRLYDPDRAQPVIRVPGAYPKPGEEC